MLALCVSILWGGNIVAIKLGLGTLPPFWSAFWRFLLGGATVLVWAWIKRADLIRYAKQLGLNMDLFLAALDSGEYRAIVERDKAEGARLGVNGTPAFFINDKKLVGAQPIAAFQDLIEKELSHLKVDSAPPIADRSNGMSVKGSADAPVTVSVFADFQSPMSTQAAVLMKKNPFALS